MKTTTFGGHSMQFSESYPVSKIVMNFWNLKLHVCDKNILFVNLKIIQMCKYNYVKKKSIRCRVLNFQA